MKKHVPPPPVENWSHGKPLFVSVRPEFLFRERIPVGFVFPKLCPAWGVDMREAFAAAISERLLRDAELLLEGEKPRLEDVNVESWASELSSISVEAFPLDALCRQLGLLEQYKTWARAKYGSAVRDGTDEEVRMRQMELQSIDEEN